MKADPVLLREIGRMAGKTRSERTFFLRQCEAFAHDLGKAIKGNNGMQSLKSIYDRVTLQYPRAVNACCLAATISMRDGMSKAAQIWAYDVLNAWKPTASHRLMAYIDDNLNPTRIEEYAGSFIRITSIY